LEGLYLYAVVKIPITMPSFSWGPFCNQTFCPTTRFLIFSTPPLTVVLYGHDKKSLERALPEVVRVFTSADGNLFSESYNQLNAYFATVPGNYRHNLRRLFLLNTNYADLSFLFTILSGENGTITLAPNILRSLRPITRRPIS
jgi:hypothetical protein